MDPSILKSWLGMSTTGQGFAGVLTIVAAVATGQMPWTAAIPALIGAAVLIVWPQETGLSKVATTLATDTEAAIPLLLKAYEAGLTHGVGSEPAPVAQVGMQTNPAQQVAQ